jgi:hypothetical protein
MLRRCQRWDGRQQGESHQPLDLLFGLHGGIKRLAAERQKDSNKSTHQRGQRHSGSPVGLALAIGREGTVENLESRFISRLLNLGLL